MDNYARVASTKDRLREIMEQRNLKQADLVRETGMNRGTISRYLSGEVEPRQDAAYKLAKVLDVAELWLWGYDVPQARTESQKKNDNLVAIVSTLRKDADFYELVCMLDSLPAEQRANIKQLVAALADK